MSEKISAGTGLSRSQVLEFWERENPDAYRLLTEMEHREHWLLSQEQLTRLVGGLEAVVSKLSETDYVEMMGVPEKAAMLATLVGYIGAPQFISFLLSAESIEGGVTSKIVYALGLSEQKNQVFVELFNERLLLVLRHDLYGKVFSKERSERVLNVIDYLKDEDDIYEA